MVFMADSCKLAWFGLKKAACETIIMVLCLEQWCMYHDFIFHFRYVGNTPGFSQYPNT